MNHQELKEIIKYFETQWAQCPNIMDQIITKNYKIKCSSNLHLALIITTNKNKLKFVTVTVVILNCEMLSICCKSCCVTCGWWLDFHMQCKNQDTTFWNIFFIISQMSPNIALLMYFTHMTNSASSVQFYFLANLILLHFRMVVQYVYSIHRHTHTMCGSSYRHFKNILEVVQVQICTFNY